MRMKVVVKGLLESRDHLVFEWCGRGDRCAGGIGPGRGLVATQRSYAEDSGAKQQGECEGWDAGCVHDGVWLEYWEWNAACQKRSP